MWLRRIHWNKYGLNQWNFVKSLVRPVLSVSSSYRTRTDWNTLFLLHNSLNEFDGFMILVLVGQKSPCDPSATDLWVLIRSAAALMCPTCLCSVPAVVVARFHPGSAPLLRSALVRSGPVRSSPRFSSGANWTAGRTLKFPPVFVRCL